MKQLILIAGNGMGAGKTTLANNLRILSPSKVVKLYPMAGPLKEFLVTNGFLTPDQAYTPEGKKTPTQIKFRDMPAAVDLCFGMSPWEAMDKVLEYIWYPLDATMLAANQHNVDSLTESYLTARAVMQIYGSEVMRNGFGGDVWLQANAGRIAVDLLNDVDIAIMDDIRYLNEISILSNICETIRIRTEEKSFGLSCHNIFVERPDRKTTSHSSEGQIKPDDNWIVVYNNGGLDDYFETCMDLHDQIIAQDKNDDDNGFSNNDAIGNAPGGAQ